MPKSKIEFHCISEFTSVSWNQPGMPICLYFLHYCFIGRLSGFLFSRKERIFLSRLVSDPNSFLRLSIIFVWSCANFCFWNSVTFWGFAVVFFSSKSKDYPNFHSAVDHEVYNVNFEFFFEDWRISFFSFRWWERPLTILDFIWFLVNYTHWAHWVFVSSWINFRLRNFLSLALPSFSFISYSHATWFLTGFLF